MGGSLRSHGAIACVVALVALCAPAAADASMSIEVLSNRADLISGGDALVAVNVPAGVPHSSVRVTEDGRDVTSEFADRPDGRFEGVVDGLAVGPNVLTASAKGIRSARITITNHPIGGPVFSGPQIQPWLCQPSAKDRQCNAPPHYRYVYMPNGAAGLQSAFAGAGGSTNFFRPYDPDNPPSPGNIATTKTDSGVTVPYIVRIESGWQDRDQYAIALLARPGQPWRPWDSQKQFAHKMLITHGTGCAGDHSTVPPPSVLEDAALARGYAVMSTALDNAGHNCNVVTQAESLVMAKEHFEETYGSLRYTIGSGCSGGALTMLQVANAYPGIYQGLLPQCSFPDAWTTIQQAEDLALVRAYVEFSERWAPGVVWTSAQIAAVEGHPVFANAIELDIIFGPLLNPSAPCNGVPADQRFDVNYNRKGVRCSLADYMINVFGPRKQDGYAGRPYDNVGVQYGLQALKNGVISPAAFADLNEKAGSHDINGIPNGSRVAADTPALAYAYRSGAVNEANNLKDVAIIDLRGSDQGLAHDAYRSFALRERLDRANGTHANQVIWEGAIPIVGDVSFISEGFKAMDRWLSAVSSDDGGAPLAQKIIDDKPSDVQDRCTLGVGLPVSGPAGCALVDPTFTTPRMVAGEGRTTDNVKCQLVPLSRGSYAPATFTDAQWGQLQKAFPSGVCDFSRGGVDQQPTVPWLTYEAGPGGRALGPAPVSSTVSTKKHAKHKKKHHKKKKHKKAKKRH